jgi:hypothetical protein
MRTKITARFIQDNDGLYPCLCGQIVDGKKSADAHLKSLSDDEIKASHSKASWANRLKMKLK